MAQASQLAAKGKTQREISKALGVSLMTFHRWKKAVGSHPQPDPAPASDSAADKHDLQPKRLVSSATDNDVKRLEAENAQLKRLVAEMLLEKLNWQDQLKDLQERAAGRSNRDK
ncbi:helix-turn-helix domain-containing protein [Bradyrhizobium sp. HKCCYLS3077]|uniref:helix-turn-helix domain-containing protein n=1 Tax=Bradyrhizobium sp. HKCCYLS3077 TaxID=3420761 RepID=UPI003EB90444